MNWNELFSYSNGSLFWKEKQNGFVPAGAKAGTPRDGYVLVMVDGVNYGAHCIIWEMHNGPIPSGLNIDHEDQVRNNNLIGNLRLVTHAVNMKNKTLQKNNSSGQAGVSWNTRRKKWVARINANGKKLFLGQFSDLPTAISVRKDAEILHGYHPNHGK